MVVSRWVDEAGDGLLEGVSLCEELGFRGVGEDDALLVSSEVCLGVAHEAGADAIGDGGGVAWRKEVDGGGAGSAGALLEEGLV